MILLIITLTIISIIIILITIIIFFVLCAFLYVRHRVIYVFTLRKRLNKIYTVPCECIHMYMYSRLVYIHTYM